jgi:hypothetical protein
VSEWARKNVSSGGRLLPYRARSLSSEQGAILSRDSSVRCGLPLILPARVRLSLIVNVISDVAERKHTTKWCRVRVATGIEWSETAGRRSAVSGLQRRASGARPGLVSSAVVVRSLGGECRVRVLKQGGSLRGLSSCDSSGTYDWRPWV